MKSFRVRIVSTIIFISIHQSFGFVSHLHVANIFNRRSLLAKPDVYKISRMVKRPLENDDNDDYDKDYEYANLRRRRYGKFANDDTYKDGASASTSSGSRNRSEYDVEEDEFDDFDSEYEDEYDDQGDEDDDFDDIIPNPLLDQIDPDGAIERLPELFSDPQFWKDSTIWFFIAFLWLLGRFNNPMLNGLVDLDKVDFNQFYAK